MERRVQHEATRGARIIAPTPPTSRRRAEKVAPMANQGVVRTTVRPDDPTVRPWPVRDHRPHGGMTGDAAEPVSNGYRLTVACGCGVVFERWVTPEERTPIPLALRGW